MRSLLYVAALAAVANAQWGEWADNQTNSTLCAWQDPRAILLRDTIYIDGGASVWIQGLNDGSYNKPFSSNNDMGIIATISLNETFNISASGFNITAQFGNLSKATGGGGNSASATNPNAISGALLGNSAEMYFYGGLVTDYGIYPLPSADAVLNYAKYEFGPSHVFTQGFSQDTLDNGTNRYITYGAGTTVPSEWKAFYFSGLHSQAGPIEVVAPNASWAYTEVADFMITLTTNAEDYLDVAWTNSSLPSSVKGRAMAEFVFVPVGSNGIMVAVGGATYPSVAYDNNTSVNPTLSTSQSLEFLRVVDVYDIGADKWYQQNSTFADTPPVLSRGCAVMAEAPDKSSFNIYYYGGYTAQSELEDYSDDVWVLSIPSFTWTKVYSGTAAHARVGHKCFQPYPDQMMVLGGMQPLSASSGFTCIQGIMQMFNMSSLKWMDAYDPTVYANYTVPAALTKVIGGTSQGSATKTTPVAGWTDGDLKSVFSTSYPTSRITTYYPYQTASDSTGTSPGSNATSGAGAASKPSSGISKGAIAAIVVCVVVGVAFLVGIFLWWRRRQIAKYDDTASVRTITNNSVMAWILGIPNVPPPPAKAMTETTDTSATFAAPHSPASEPEILSIMPKIHYEMDASTASAVELDATPRAELSDTGMTPVQIVDRKWAASRAAGGAASASGMSSVNGSSFISRESGPDSPMPTSPQSADSPVMPESVDSPVIPQSPTQPDTPVAAPAVGAASRVVSDVSSVSEGEARHLRHVSGISVSTVASGDDAGVASRDFGAIPESPDSEQVSTPIQTNLNQSTESVGTKSPYSQGRRSIFHESLDHVSEARPTPQEQKTEKTEKKD